MRSRFATFQESESVPCCSSSHPSPSQKPPPSPAGSPSQPRASPSTWGSRRPSPRRAGRTSPWCMPRRQIRSSVTTNRSSIGSRPARHRPSSWSSFTTRPWLSEKARSRLSRSRISSRSTFPETSPAARSARSVSPWRKAPCRRCRKSTGSSPDVGFRSCQSTPARSPMGLTLRSVLDRLPTFQQVSEAPIELLQKIDEVVSLPVATFIVVVVLMSSIGRHGG